jgi:hypothetical protein
MDEGLWHMPVKTAAIAGVAAKASIVQRGQ